MPTRSDTPSDPWPGLAVRPVISVTAGQDHSTTDVPASVSARPAPAWNRVRVLPAGRGATVTGLGQAIRLAKLAAPIHPILVHFTIALTVTSFAFDLLVLLFGFNTLRAVGWWTLAAAVLVTMGTIATGVKSRLRLPIEEGEARSFLRVHMALGPSFFGLLVALGIWRGELWQAGSAVTWWYIVSMIGVMLVMAAQGYLGGELVYRYGAEVKFRYRELPGRSQRFPGFSETEPRWPDDEAPRQKA
ncbi:MAG: DUF2231 domain-containing protein [Methylocella sp.]